MNVRLYFCLILICGLRLRSGRNTYFFTLVVVMSYLKGNMSKNSTAQQVGAVACIIVKPREKAPVKPLLDYAFLFYMTYEQFCNYQLVIYCATHEHYVIL